MADVQIDQDAANIGAINLVDGSTDPATPGSGHAKLFMKDGTLYVRLDSGTVAAVGGVPTLAEGRLAIGDGDDLLSALAVGTPGHVVTADASGFASWAAPTGGDGGGDALIAEVTVPAGGQSTVTFSSIPGTYRELILLGRVRSERTGVYFEQLRVTLNQNATANVRSRVQGWTESGLGYNFNYVDQTYATICAVPTADSPSNSLASIDVRLPSYTVANFNKVLMGHTIAHLHTQGDYSQFSMPYAWTQLSAALTRLDLVLENGGDFAEGSWFGLFGRGEA